MKIDVNSTFHQARCVDEAVEIAEYLSRTGLVDMFRGQTRSFPPVPTILREGVDRRGAMARLNNLAAWIHEIPELASLHGNKDGIVAVAQHYGMATNFLDFSSSPQVAGFFASDGEPPPVSDSEYKPSCIICASKEWLEESWAEMNSGFVSKGEDPLVRVVEIDVNNLWRLQAQSGLFLQIRVDTTLLEMFSSLVRIQFPFTQLSEGISSVDVYPDRKSHLESLLDHYFYWEFSSESMKRLEEFFDVIVTAPEEPFLGYPEAFEAKELPPKLESWNETQLAPWLVEPSESLGDTHGPNSIRIKLRLDEDAKRLSRRVRSQVRRAFGRNSEIRKNSISWSFKNADGTDFTVDDEDSVPSADGDIDQIRGSELLVLLWDGMRRLPYSDDQIATCIGNFVVFVSGGLDAQSRLLGKTVGVEFSSEGIVNRGSVSSEGLWRCVRSDLYDLLKESEVPADVKPSAYLAISVLVDASRLLEFDNLVDFFANELIPTQMVFRCSGEAIIFSPARLKVLGRI